MTSGQSQMRIGLIGCGVIARTHLKALQNVPELSVCAVADPGERARSQIADLAGVPGYVSAAELLANEKPDAVHILTPPSSHGSLAAEAMEAGAHVLVEKPMALSTSEAQLMMDVSARTARVLGTCHNTLFKPAMRRAIEIVREGTIGTVVHVEIFWGAGGESGRYDGDPGANWAWRLPGGWFTNFLPHTISLQQAFLGPDLEVQDVLVGRDAANTLKPTELVVTTRTKSGWGVMTISTVSQPPMRSLVVYGTGGLVRVDLAREICVVQRQRRAPGMVNKVLFSMDHARQLVTGTTLSTAMVLLGKWRNNPGMVPLVEDFYASIRSGRNPTVGGDAGYQVARTMEQIWAEAGTRLDPPHPSLHRQVQPATAGERSAAAHPSMAGRFLVTGATGFLGSRVARALNRCGAEVVTLVRDRSRLPFDIESFAEVIEGDLGDAQAAKLSADGVIAVIHCAAATSNSAGWQQHHEDTVLGTASLCEAAVAAGVDRFVHISSVVVYGLDGLDGQVVGEETPLSGSTDRWAHYLRAKVEAERVVRGFEHDRGLAATILRPGVLYGPGRKVKAGVIQIGGWWVAIGSARNSMPFTFVDNAVDAVVLASVTDAAIGRAFNIVDDPQLGAAALLESAGSRCRIIPVPAGLVDLFARLAERRSASASQDVAPRLSRFAVRSAVRDIRYDTTRARDLLGWQSEVAAASALQPQRDVELLLEGGRS